MMTYKQQKGFTTIELLVVVVIMAIIATLAVPSMQSFIRKSQLNREAQDLIYAFNDIRVKSITERKDYTLKVETGDKPEFKLESTKPEASLVLDSKKVSWDQTEISNVEFNYMGRIKNMPASNQINACFILQHASDNSLKQVIVVQSVGNIAVRKDLTDCSSYK